MASIGAPLRTSGGLADSAEPADPADSAAASCLLREVRLVPLCGARTGGVADLRIREGVIREVGAPGERLRARPGEEVHEGGGRFAIPGLWDGHVHLGQEAATSQRLDLSGTRSPEECTARVAAHVRALPAGSARATVQAWGHRSATWARSPTVAELDAVSGDHPVVLVSGDGHNGWLNSAALDLLGQPGRAGALDEDEWFALWGRLTELPGVREQTEAGYGAVLRAAAARGIVGVVDMEMATNHVEWPARFVRLWGTPGGGFAGALRVRCATYPAGLDAVVAAGLRTGNVLAGSGGLVEMGPLKVITDGSLNTRTAYCCEPYADAAPCASGSPEPPEHPEQQGASARGKQNVPPDELRLLLMRARRSGLQVAVHAIGDAAVADALDAFEVSGAAGSIEHAQLMRVPDVTRMASLGVVASVQPAHLLDDRDVTLRCWPDRMDRCFLFRSMLDAGVTLRLGSDAPVSPLDPWLQMAAAVHRSGDDRPPWAPEQAVSVTEALAASTDGRSLVVGEPGDVVLLDTDPLAASADSADSAEAAAYLRSFRSAATFVGGRLVFG